MEDWLYRFALYAEEYPDRVFLWAVGGAVAGIVVVALVAAGG